MKKLFFILTIIIIAGCSDSNGPSDINSFLCIRVVDGDTYDFVSNNDTIRIRHLYIDCFETSKGSRLDKQAERAGISSDSALTLGLLAKEYVKNIIEFKKCILLSDTNESDKDIYGRYLRTVTINNQRLDSLLLKNGLAFPYK
jgi:micrococcal nuclease